MDLRLFADIPLRRKLHHIVLHLAAVDQGGLPVERYSALAHEVGPLLWLDVNGGDPFARPDLVELVSGFKAEVLTVITPVIDVDTVVAGARTLLAACKCELVLALELDGLHQTHDRRHGEGSWDRIWSAFDALRKIDGLRIELRTNVRPDNQHELMALAEYAWRQQPDCHVMTLPASSGADDLELDALKRLEGPLFELLGRYAPDDGRWVTRLRRRFHRLRWTTAVRTLVEERQVVPCLAGLSHAVVRSNGDVASCDLLPAIGNLGNNSWDQVWSGDALQAQRQYIGAGGCHCTDDCAMHDSIALRPQNLPRLLATAG